VPVDVEGLTSGVQAVATGPFHACALVNGGVLCWGDNFNGQLGNNSTTNSSVPVPVQGLTSGVQAIAVGGSHTCALVNGGVQCWGFGHVGQLGDNSTIDSWVPVQVQGLTTGVQAIAAGYVHTCALVNGGIRCWGQNYYGQLGNGSTTSPDPNVGIAVPVDVVDLTSGVQAIAAGEYHTCAVVNGVVQCWGRNVSGQLGNDSTADSHVPVPVTSLLP
jgi:alpha-tubulin suppressor-like RCC1 family protein